MAAFQPQLKNLKGLFIFIYALTFWAADAGPNLTTFGRWLPLVSKPYP